MEDVTARIIVTAESSMAVQGLNNVRKALDDVAEARMKELQLEKARAQFELAEFESARAAEKAYAAEIPLRGAERQLESLKEQHQAHIEMYKTKKQLGELDEKQNRKWTRALKKEAAEVDSLKGKVQELTKAYLPLANAEAGANLTAFNAKQKLDALGNSTENAAKETEKFSWKMAGARMASRLFSMDLGATSNNMIKYGILAAGAASAAKLVKWGFEQMDKAMIEDAELWKRNNENIKETAASWAEARSRQNEALDTIRQYNGQTEISAVDSLKMAKAIKSLRGEFGDLGFEIDEATGRIKNFDKASAALKRKQIEREKTELQNQLAGLAKEREAQEKIRNEAGWSLRDIARAMFGDTAVDRITGKTIKINQFAKGENFMDDWVWGGGDTMTAASNRIAQIQDEMTQKQLRLRELMRLTPEADAEKEAKAREIDASRTFNRRIQEWQTQVKIQLLRNQGLEKEARLLEINARLDKERLGLANDQQRAVFDKMRQEIIDAEMMQRWETPTQHHSLDIAKEFTKYRATAQSAIDANSAEGWRLQTRRLTSADMGDPQKSSAESLKTVVKQGAETNAKLENLTRQVAALTSGGAKITVAARKY